MDPILPSHELEAYALLGIQKGSGLKNIESVPLRESSPLNVSWSI